MHTLHITTQQKTCLTFHYSSKEAAVASSKNITHMWRKCLAESRNNLLLVKDDYDHESDMLVNEIALVEIKDVEQEAKAEREVFNIRIKAAGELLELALEEDTSSIVRN